MTYHHGSLPHALVTAARRLLRTRPAAELSIREVARAVGVSANAPYRHFADREALLRAVATAGYRDLVIAVAGKSGSRSIAKAWSALAESEPGLVELMSGPALVAHEPEQALQDAQADWLAEIARAIESEVAEDAPEAVIRAAVERWASLVGLTRLRASGALAALDEWMLPET